jgi:FixJ family two-component response regulator
VLLAFWVGSLESTQVLVAVFLTITTWVSLLLSLPLVLLRGRHLSGRVYIVDDDASFRTATERRLNHAGYEVATYASAEHLLDRLPSDSVSGCILLDVRIPGLSGPELQERLSELGSTLPIIFLTGYPDVRTTVRTIKAGAEDFLTKPVSSDKLLQAVEQAIARHNGTYRLKPAGDGPRSYRGINAA